MNVNDLLNKALNPNNGKYYITEDVLKDIKENFISKDKIRKKIEQIKMKADYDWLFKYDYEEVIDILQELLQEGDK